MKSTVRYFLISLMGLVILWHFLSSQVGYPSWGRDFGAHFTIIEELKHGSLFPEIRDASINENSVSKYLPIYSGILGAHFLTLIIHLLTGLSLVKVMLLLTDLAIVLTIHSLYRIAKKAEVSVGTKTYLFLTQVLLLVYQIEFGFYAQMLGISIGYFALSRELDSKRHLFALIAGLFYPDILLWVLPDIFLSFRNSAGQVKRLFAFATLAVWGALLAVLASRTPLNGTAEVDWVSYIALIGIFVFMVGKLPTKTLILSTSFVFITVLLIGWSELRFGQIRYYARKPLYWSPVFIAMLLPDFQWKNRIVILMLPLAFFIAWDWSSIQRQVQFIVSGSGVLTSGQEGEIRSLLKSERCEDGTFLPSRADLSATAFQMINAISGQSDFARMKLRSSELGSISTTDPNQAYEKTRNLPPPRAKFGDWNLYCDLTTQKEKYAPKGE